MLHSGLVLRFHTLGAPVRVSVLDTAVTRHCPPTSQQVSTKRFQHSLNFARACLKVAHSLAAAGGIRILSEPFQSGLHRLLAHAKIRAPHADLMTFLGDFLASILTAVLSAPLNQLYNFAIISKGYTEAGPLQKMFLAWQFLERTYLVWDANGDLIGLSRTFARDLFMRCAYLATLMSLFGAAERVAVVLGRNARASLQRTKQQLPFTRSEPGVRNAFETSDDAVNQMTPDAKIVHGKS